MPSYGSNARRILRTDLKVRRGGARGQVPAEHRRGRPPKMHPAALLERIQRLAHRREGLFRIHITHRDLYSRARRQFGSWAKAVRAAGLDYEAIAVRARTRAAERRRRLTIPLRATARQRSSRMAPARGWRLARG